MLLGHVANLLTLALHAPPRPSRTWLLGSEFTFCPEMLSHRGNTQTAARPSLLTDPTDALVSPTPRPAIIVSGLRGSDLGGVRAFGRPRVALTTTPNGALTPSVRVHASLWHACSRISREHPNATPATAALMARTCAAAPGKGWRLEIMVSLAGEGLENGGNFHVNTTLTLHLMLNASHLSPKTNLPGPSHRRGAPACIPGSAALRSHDRFYGWTVYSSAWTRTSSPL